MANVSDQIYHDLKRSIISGQFAPGVRLREEQISQTMNASRTPVRAALARLVLDGLVVQEGRATIVASWTPWDIEEIFSLRLMLEAHGAGLAAQRASAEEIDAMDAINEEMRHWATSSSPGRLAKVQEANRRFHFALLSAAGSGRLSDILSGFLDIPQMIGSFYYYSDQEILSSVDHHRQMVAAIRDKNEVLAQDAMRFHLGASLARFRSARSKSGQSST